MDLADTLLRTLRHTLRALRRSPSSSLAAVVALALGIGLTATMYAILDGIFLRGLPFEQSDRLLHLERNDLERGIESMEVTWHDFVDWREQQRSFEGIAAFNFGGTINLADEDLPDRYSGAWISANFLELLREQPALGRGFTAADERAGATPVMLIGHHVWQKRYGGDPGIVGRVVRANAEPTTIVGVLPEGFRFPMSQDVWLPLEPELDIQRGEGTTYEVFGRLAEGVDRDRAALELATIAERLAQQYPETNEGVGTVVQPFVYEYIGEETRLLLKVMFAAVLLVLLIACFNVANLLIGRAALRGRELAIRSAVGAGRARAIGRVLAEASVLAVAGGLLGVGLAHVGLKLFDRHLSTLEQPFWFRFELGPAVLGLVLAVTVAAALVSGIVPALQASRPDLAQVLQDAARGSSFRLGRLSRVLVILEVAMSCALLIASGLTVRSILAAQSYDLRFDPSGLLTARLGLFEGEYPEASDQIAFHDRLRERVVTRPGVLAAAIATTIPADTEIGANGTGFERPDEVYEHPRDMPFTRLTQISPGYFETLGIRLLAGRDFTEADREGAPRVAIVNRDFADKEWPGESPIGKQVDLWMGDDEEAADPAAGRVEVVGLVPDLRFADFDNDDDQMGVYVPLAQQPQAFAWVIVRTRGDPLELADPLRRTVLELDPNLPLYFVRSMEQVLEQTMFYHNLLGFLFSIFGAVALVLAVIGLYGVMAFAVGQRRREMGVRMAFGARALDVAGLVLRQGFFQTGIGVVLGLGLGFALSLGLAAVLFQVRPYDPPTYVLVPILLFLITALACLVPARRAAAVDPIETLRYE